MLRRALKPEDSVVVHTRDGQSVAGVLTGRYRDGLALSHARLLQPDGQNVALDGEAVIPADNVAFVQRRVVIDDSQATR